jgi:hypothetical protein
MATTPNYGWTIPTVGGDNNTWGTELNTFLSNAGAPLGVDQVVAAISVIANAALPKAGGTMTGRLIGLTESMHYVDKGNVSGGISVDASAAQHQKMTVTSAVTSVSFTNLPASGEAYAIAFEIVNGGIGFTWGAAFKWPAATPPVLTNPGTDIVTIITHDAGTTWRMLGIQKDVR